MDIVVERLTTVSSDGIAPLLAESERFGWQHVRQLADEWTSGINRFDRPGEALFGATVEGKLIGVCGLNIDPYAGDPKVGRIRHLYVLSEFRGHGVARQLVQAVIALAKSRFAMLRLRTECPDSAAFYERLGFRRTRDADSTHMLELTKS